MTAQAHTTGQSVTASQNWYSRTPAQVAAAVECRSETGTALTTVFGPLQAFLKTTSLDVRQWFICLAVALSIVVMSEIGKAVWRHTASGQQEVR